MAAEGKIKIECSDCGQQFDVDPELVGRLVECGECKYHFRVDDSCIVKQTMRHYPGEKAADLSMFSKRIPAVETSSDVGFRTAAYEQQVDPNDVMPLGAKRLMCIFVGIILVVFVSLLFVFGNDPKKIDGLMLDVGNDKRYILCGFTALISSLLLIYGFRKKRVVGVLLSVLFSGGLLALPSIYPEYFSPQSDQELTTPLTTYDEDHDAAKKMLKYKSGIGYGPVETAIKSAGPEKVLAVVLFDAKGEYLDTVESYLSQGLKNSSIPKVFAGSSRHVDDRKVDLILFSSIAVDFEQAAEVCQGFGKVLNKYPELRVIEVEVSSKDLVSHNLSILTDESSIDFYNANYRELSHIDPERQLAAIRRLGAAKEVGRRADVVNMLLRKLADDTYPYKEDIVGTLLKWAKPEDNAGPVVKKVAQKQVEINRSMPQVYLDFLIDHNEPNISNILLYAWKKEPVIGEPYMIRAGKRAEEALVEDLPQMEKKYLKSAASILRKIGTRSSVPVLEACIERADEDSRQAIESAIDAMKTRE